MQPTDPTATPDELTVTLTPDHGVPPTTATLRRDGTGDHPAPDAAWAAVEVTGLRGFAPVPPGAMCTQVYGGPEEATVTGSLGGVAVDARFRRTNGCEIDRWGRLAPLLDLG